MNSSLIEPNSVIIKSTQYERKGSVSIRYVFIFWKNLTEGKEGMFCIFCFLYNLVKAHNLIFVRFILILTQEKEETYESSTN